MYSSPDHSLRYGNISLHKHSTPDQFLLLYPLIRMYETTTMKKLCLTLLAVYTIVYTVKAQTIISLADTKPVSAVNPFADQAVYEDEVSDAHVIWAAPGFKKDRTGASTLEQLFILEGQARFTIGGHPRKLSPGYWIILPANTPHTLEVVSDAPLKLLSIQDKGSTPSPENE